MLERVVWAVSRHEEAGQAHLTLERADLRPGRADHRPFFPLKKFTIMQGRATGIAAPLCLLVTGLFCIWSLFTYLEEHEQEFV